jgi:hypothetical protein
MRIPAAPVAFIPRRITKPRRLWPTIIQRPNPSVLQEATAPGFLAEGKMSVRTIVSIAVIFLAQLSRLGEKGEQYQCRRSESLHYTALAGRRAIFSGVVMRGGGCGGRSSLRWRARSFRSAVSSV